MDSDVNSSKEQRFHAIKRQVLITQVMGFPGLILLALGLYGLFGAEGDAFLPVLNNQNVVYACLAVGGALELWQMFRIYSLQKQRMALSGAESL